MAPVREVNIGGVTLDLAMLAMAARGVTLSRALQSPVAAVRVARPRPQHQETMDTSLRQSPTEHRPAWISIAAAVGENIGGVTLDLAIILAKLAKLAMAAMGVTLPQTT